jgi:hypothetical protein
MTENESVWSERVQEFRRSGKTVPAFVEGRGFTASALKYWIKKLKPTSTPMRPIALARIVRPGTVGSSPPFGAGVELVVEGVRIVVHRGFDAELVREVVAALTERT